MIVLTLLASFANAQYWQQKVDYTIAVSLNAKEKTLDGKASILYTNNSPDTLYYIWFHLWPNAYRSDKTAFSEQMLENGNTRFYFSSREEKGYINRLDFKVEGITARMEDHPSHMDIIKIILPHPLAPGEQKTITTPFHVKLPYNFSRSGYHNNSFQVTQWYPKPAVYDKDGWHPMPYLDQGEFYSEFGTFDVTISLPQNLVVAATGNLQDEEEKAWLKSRTFKVAEASKPKKITSKKPVTTGVSKKISEEVFSSQTKTLRYIQENVHDFAWFASPDYVVAFDTINIEERAVEVFAFYEPGNEETWKDATNYAKEAIQFFSEQVGSYPYNVASIVQGPEGYAGGMEYPTITIISPHLESKDLDIVIAHEIGHNWFYGILASNERMHPWMDEGLTSFYEQKYETKKYGAPSNEVLLLQQTRAVRRTDQPISTSSGDLSYLNYGLSAYYKAAAWFEMIEAKLGSERFNLLIKEYFTTWKFKHPSPSNLTGMIAKYLPSDSSFYLSLLDKKGILPYHQPRGFQFVSVFKKNSIKNYLQNPAENIVFVSPAIGSNHYDKFMLGALITNYKLPPTKFNFLAIPLYAFGSKQFTGLGKLNYSIHSDGLIRKTDFFINASMFARDDFADTAGRKITMNFKKLVPGVRFTLGEKNARSTVRKQIQWKTFFIDEEFLSIRRDTIFDGADTNLIFRYLKPSENRYLNQLQFTYENFRALYPFRIQLQVEQSTDFIRPTLTTTYFFNYAKKGGLSLRFFAGKFIYLGEKDIFKRFENERYHLNLTGPNGYEDYTYSNYFMGRNEFEGISSQQIIMRDGAFKVRTDLLANKVGKTDDWLLSLNLSSTVPDNINPLNVLPVKIPLSVFFDLGTYAEPWQRNSDADRFLYNAGLQLSLFAGSLDIYIPIAYNKVFGDYIKSTIPDNRFLKTISFSINFLNNRNLQEINRELEF